LHDAGRVLVFLEGPEPNLDTILLVHPQEIRRSPANSGQTNDFAIRNLKVFRPSLFSGIEQRHKGLAHWINGREIRALEFVASATSECQIVEVVSSPMCQSDDMFDLVRPELSQRLGMTILAQIARPLGKMFSKLSGCHAAWAP